MKLKFWLTNCIKHFFRVLSGIFFGCLRGRNKAPFPMRFRRIFSQFVEKNSQSQLKIISIVQFLVKYKFCCLKCYLAWYFMLLLNDSKCLSLINYVNLVVLSILNILKISQIQGYVANFPNWKGPRAPSQNCQKNPWLFCLILSFMCMVNN